jgi:RNA polymerase sigma factor (sigma-70 family)
MAATLDAPIAIHGTSGDARVDHAELARQLHVLHPQCFGWALACCRYRREDAEDVLQDVYMGVLDNGLRFNGRSSLRTWIFGVIRHKARARLRRDRLRALLGVAHVSRIDIPAPAPSPDESALASERSQRTRRALALLPRRQSEVLMLVFYHELTIEEAAGVMGVSIGTARVHYDRGKKRLATLLAEERP